MAEDNPRITDSANDDETLEGKSPASPARKRQKPQDSRGAVGRHWGDIDKWVADYFASEANTLSAAYREQNAAALQSAARIAAKYANYTSNVPTQFSNLPDFRALVGQIAQFPSLSRSRDFEGADETAGSYSPELETPGTFFELTERKIESFTDLNRAITLLIKKTPNLSLVWRGVSDASWGLHSSLYRKLHTANGVERPEDSPRGSQPFPDEDQMVEAEREILRLARSDWRFDHLSALEIFARLQHVGGPTRLIDVTRNPYVGAWFAVEHNELHGESDARLFALATGPVLNNASSATPEEAIQLDSSGSSRDPFWHALTDHDARQELDWGTGSRRRLWVPPVYDSRIAAQSAAFILDGVPITSDRTATQFPIGEDKAKHWGRADLLAAASIYTKMYPATRKPPPNAFNFSPTFSFRITKEAKKEIRGFLEAAFGYRKSHIYPDINGLSEHLSNLVLTSRSSEL